MPLVYRVWAAARVRDCMDWQEKWTGDGQHGCRPKHGTSNAILRIGLETETALLNNEELAGAALDFSKAFDNVPIAITLAVLKRLGLHERIFNPLLDTCAQLQRRFKIRGCLGSPFIATHGIMQGCPLSALLLNAIVMVMTSAVQEKVPEGIDKSYVDDLALMTCGQEQLRECFSKIERFIRLTDQKLNVKKTYTFGVNCTPEVIYQGETVPSAELIKILGFKLMKSGSVIENVVVICLFGLELDLWVVW